MSPRVCVLLVIGLLFQLFSPVLAKHVGLCSDSKCSSEVCKFYYHMNPSGCEVTSGRLYVSWPGSANFTVNSVHVHELHPDIVHKIPYDRYVLHMYADTACKNYITGWDNGEDITQACNIGFYPAEGLQLSCDGSQIHSWLSKR